MKAIEILFDKIDELNTKLKSEEKIRNKINVVADIRELANLICQVADYLGMPNNNEDYI